jgi:hypothetical protein
MLSEGREMCALQVYLGATPDGRDAYHRQFPLAIQKHNTARRDWCFIGLRFIADHGIGV